MGLIKRGKSWYYDFWFEGIRYQKSTKMKDKRKAQAVEDAVRTDLARRKFTLPSKGLRFSELCERYAEFAISNGKPAYMTEKYHIATHLVPHFGEILVHAINLDVCERYKKNRLKTGDKKSTINREIGTLKAILKYAGESGRAPEGLGRFARMYKDVETEDARYLSRQEVESIFAACASLEFCVLAPYLLPIVIVAVYTGCRPSEYKALGQANLDFDHRLISVRKSKTKAGIRTIPMKPEVFDALCLWLPKRKGAWVFPSPRKPGMYIQDFGKAFDKAAKQAGLTGVTPYSLRHTFATELDGRAVSVRSSPY